MIKGEIRSYRKRPLVIQAMQYNGANQEQIKEFVGKKLSAYNRNSNKFYINTLEGMALVDVNDYIIKGIVGEFYCCKQAVFEQSYEEVEDGTE